MEVPLQQRIVGAIVLVTLGVIFIPALLDGSGYKTRQAKDIVIREKPAFPPLSQKKLEPVPTPLDSKLASKLASKSDSKNKQSSSKTTATELTSVNNSQPVSDPKTATKETVVTEQTEQKKPSKSFAIQVGTFDSNENAEKVRNKLRKAGYTTYIQKSTSKSKTTYRVRIGPELDYDVLEKQLEVLKKSKKIDGYIVNHP